MPTETLRTNLHKLRQELANPGKLDKETRQQLAEVAETIDTVLNEDAPDFEHAQARIQDAALRFEANHPRFSRIMGEITDALAKLGI